MVSFLINKFIKNPENVSDPAVRRKYGLVCGGLGVLINMVLFLAKLAAGLISGSVAAVADAFNNLSDAGSSVVTLLGFRLAAQAPDREHPYGHGRFEYISGMIVSAAILLMGVELLRSGIGKIIHPSAVQVNPALIAALILSILMKLYMAMYNSSVGKKINSAAMRATAIDSLGDCAATGAVLLSAALAAAGIAADGWAAALVSAFILIAGAQSFKATVALLLGKAPPEEFVEKINAIAASHGDILGIHDLAVHDYGPGRMMVSLHAEVSGEGDIFALHEAIDALEREISREMSCETVIHMDPVEKSEGAPELKARLEELIKREVDGDITIHDLRLHRGEGHTLTFDSAIPPRLSPEAEAVKLKIEAAVAEGFPGYRAETKIDIQL